MSKPADDERLLAVAGSISDGLPVDWNEVRERFSASGDTAIVDELRVLHGLATAHQEPQAWGPLHTFDMLGRGSFATVYRAFDADLHREIALKITTPQPSAAADPQGGVHEARLLARVRHPNVVTVFGAQRRGDAVAIAMELIRGRTLDDLVRQQGPLSASEATLIGLHLCRAVAAVHEAGLLHGDIKAHNVMREDGGRIVLMDFGTGKDLQAPVRATSDFAGTPLYLAPEVFAGQPRTKSSDIYSLGILLFYLASATYPVTGDTRSDVDRRHFSGDARRRRLRDVRPDLPADFVSVVERAIAEDPAHRYRTAGELEAALDSIDQRRRGFSVQAIAALVVLVAGLLASGVYLASLWSDSRRPPAGAAAVPPPAPIDVTGPRASGTYRIDAAVYRAGDGAPQRLRSADRVAPGDALFLQLQASVPVYVYVVNEDSRGTALVLYPLPGQSREPLAASVPTRLPGVVDGGEKYWQVSERGEREHLVIFCSPTRVEEIERLVAAMPAPREGVRVQSAELKPDVISTLRSLGGLVSAPREAPARPRLSEQYTTPLSDEPEDARGLWVRQITFENPGRK